MPIPYLIKLHKEHKIPMKKLEEYWDKAKSIASNNKRVSDYYAYAIGIFKKMLSLNESVSMADLPKHPIESLSKSPSRKTAIVSKTDDQRIKELEDQGYKLVGPVKGVNEKSGAGHLLYELKAEPEEVKPKEPESKEPEEEADDDGPLADTEDDDTSIPKWWRKLSREEQEEYLEEHPRSRLKVTAPEGTVEHPAWWDKMDRNEQREYIKEHPEEGFKITAPREEGDEEDDGENEDKATESIKGNLVRTWAKHRAKVADKIRHHKQGLKAIKTLLSGGKVTKDDLSKAKKTAGAIAMFTVVLFAAAVAPTIALAIGNRFLDDILPNMSSSSGDSESSEDSALEISDLMFEWLAKQDVPALIKELEAQSEQ